MSDGQTTCWTLIREAADGRGAQRQDFALRYGQLVRHYLTARWRSPPLRDEIDDACQEFFVDCFRHGGALERVEAGGDAGFRGFLYGMARNIALRFEERAAKARQRNPSNDVDVCRVEADETRLSRVYDRAWAQTIVQEAKRLQIERAEGADERARSRVELLRMRFQDGTPIRDIAKQWHKDAAELHREYAKARKEFEQALRDVVLFHHPNHAPKDVERECVELLLLLK